MLIHHLEEEVFKAMLKKNHQRRWLNTICIGSALVLSSGLALAADLTPELTTAVTDTFNVERFDLTNMDIPTDLVSDFSSAFTFEGNEFVVQMVAHSVRADGFQVLAPDKFGKLVPQPIPASRTYRGYVQGLPGAIVSASLIDGQFEGLVFVNPEIIWEIQPLSKVDPNAAPDEYIIFDSTDLLPHDNICGVDDQHNNHDNIAPINVGGGNNGSGDALKFCEIAFDADVEFYNKNGQSVPNTVADIENVLDRIDVIYQRDVEVGYEITTIIVRTQEPDPYTTTDPGALLNQFRSEWNARQTGIQRDIAHLMTGKNINGGVIGIAWLSVICSQTQGYGLSESRFTTSMTSRVGLTSHELGHNWSAQHCDGNGDCRIMCSGLGGCNRDLTRFGNLAKNQIVSHKNSRNCLSDTLDFKLEIKPAPPIKGGGRTDWIMKNGDIGTKAALFYSIKGQGMTEVAPGIFIELKNPKLISPIRTIDGNGEALWAIMIPNINVRLWTHGVDANGINTNLRWDDVIKQ